MCNDLKLPINEAWNICKYYFGCCYYCKYNSDGKYIE